MGLFKKLKKAFKKIVGGVKKVVKKVVKGVKKVAKKIGSSKILKALAVAAAVVVTGGAAIGAFTGGTATGFAGWMMNASNTITSGALFGTKVAGQPILNVLKQTGNFATKTIAKPFASLGSGAGNIARGVTDFTGLTDAATKGIVQDPTQAAEILKRSGMTPEEISSLSGAELEGAAQAYVDTQGGVGAFSMEDVEKSRSFVNESVAYASPSNKFLDTGAGKFVSNVGTSVATNVFTGAAMQSIAGEPDPTGVERGPGGQERAGAFDPLRIYAAENSINVNDIYNQALYGNVDPSSIYGSELYSQETVGVA
tara:strand:- start:3278 stop:4210 length:933 start_codon:yes stop_codon:yes gene_type:complete